MLTHTLKGIGDKTHGDAMHRRARSPNESAEAGCVTSGAAIENEPLQRTPHANKEMKRIQIHRVRVKER